MSSSGNDDRRFRRWYKFVAAVVKILFVRKTPEAFPVGGKLPSGGNLILANHVTRLDQFIIGMYYIDSRLRFVSGENVFKNSLFKRFATNCMKVIIHLRGISSYDTIREMTKGLKQGDNVMIFPTGTMTFDGRSQSIDSSIAKLAKMSSCNLVLLKTNGGYFFQPRWGITTRRGPVSITERILMASELKKMTPDEILDAINTHLYTDAYELQAKKPLRYVGKKLCKGLECCIYECPKCGEITGLKTDDTDLFCKCGFRVKYDEYGYLNDSDGVKHTITEYSDSQRENLKRRFIEARNKGENVYLFGDDFAINALHHDGKRVKVGSIRVDVYTDDIRYKLNGSDGILKYEDIDSVFVYMRNTLNVNLKGKEFGFELNGDFSSNALKYRDLYHVYDNR